MTLARISSMQAADIGIIGGSGLYDMPGLRDTRELQLDTPFGAPSDIIVSGRMDGIAVAFLARHGRGHRLLPAEVPYRANIYAMKMLGVRYLLAFSAVGSLREDLRPLDVVLPDQFIDLTRRRESTFFGSGAVAHVSMAEPVCAAVAGALARAVAAAGLAAVVRVHGGGTYVCIEGPQFSTRAESQWYRGLGADVIGMTNLPEVKLAREAQIAYATMAMVTDYDCWHPREASVTANLAMANLMKNAEHAQRIAVAAIRILGTELPASIAHTSLASALVTPPKDMAPEVRARLAAILPSGS
jgi:5'-methylthioadenosine phosphorylase